MPKSPRKSPGSRREVSVVTCQRHKVQYITTTKPHLKGGLNMYTASRYLSILRSQKLFIPKSRKLHTVVIMASKTFHDANSNTYDRMTSNSTLTIAKKVVSELDPPITSASYVLDNACGTGVVTTCIKELCSSAHIKAADLAPGMLDVVRTKISEHKWENVETEVLDVRHLTTVKDNTFTHAITNFGFVANGDDPAAPLKIAKEVWRVLKPGGVCVITTWYGMVSTLPFSPQYIYWFQVR